MTTETEPATETQNPVTETQEPMRSGDESWWQTLLDQENTNRQVAAAAPEPPPEAPLPRQHEENWYSALVQAQGQSIPPTE
jgi:hypothetical protein